MATTIECPFTIGEQYWVPQHGSEKVKATCPVCFGKLAITVILGDGERVGVPCEACGKGFAGPQGYVCEWALEPKAIQVTVTGVDGIPRRPDMGDDWRLRTEREHYTYQGRQLYTTEAEAFTESERLCAEQRERNMVTMQHKRKSGTENVGWSIRYHREQIKKLSQSIAWHEAKVIAQSKAVK